MNKFKLGERDALREDVSFWRNETARANVVIKLVAEFFRTNKYDDKKAAKDALDAYTKD